MAATVATVATPQVVPQMPMDLQNIIDKTAQFVARLGKEFETRIHTNEQNNPKFLFLKPTDAFHPYYRNKVREMMIEHGITPPPQIGAKKEKDGSKTQAVPLTPAQHLSASVKQEIPSRQVTPQNDKFIAEHPADITPLDLDIMLFLWLV